MIQIDQIRNLFPSFGAVKSQQDKQLLKEYLQLMMLDFLSGTPWIQKLVFIGGTNLRLVKGIDRFSEDLDFDCKDLSKPEFADLCHDLARFLERSGINVELQLPEKPKLTAFRGSFYFPRLLFDQHLTQHRDERFLIKVECQDQGISYQPVLADIKGAGLFFPFPVPSDETLCSMKIAAMLARAKGRDFYDLMFLLSFTRPDYGFLQKKCGIPDQTALKERITELLKTVDLKKKQRDFDHLLFNPAHSERILRFEPFISSL